MAVTIRHGTFVAWGTDPSGYLEAAHRWAAGQLATPSPMQFWASWVPDAFGLAPHGFRPGTIRGTEVGIYPLGLPLLMAGAMRVGGSLAAYVIPPLFAALFVWCTYEIASPLAGPWGAVLTAGLVAASPETLVMSAQPMSDIPAAALWMLAWAMALRPGLGATAAAGAAVAMATMVRPNLAPFGLIMILLVAWRGADDNGKRWRRVMLFVCMASIGPVMLGWSQNVLYGGPFRTGYLRPDTFYKLAHVGPNLVAYPRLLVAVHTPLLLAGLAAPLLLRRRGPTAIDERARAVMRSALAIIAVNYILYVPFLPPNGLMELRFMAPALAALFILFIGALIHGARLLASYARALAPLALLPALLVLVHQADAVAYVSGLRQMHAPVSVAGHYLRDALPRNAAVIAGAHSGPVAHYTGRAVVRLDPIAPNAIDEAIDDLTRHGYRPVLVLDDGEATFFGRWFTTSRFRGLDWPPRAEFVGGARLRYWDFADKAAIERGQRWAMDTLRAAR